jgi:regulation of enolase protein 1 (concanavalin A-like superfamily)
MHLKSLLAAFPKLTLAACLMIIPALAQTGDSSMQWQNAPKSWKQSGTSLIEEVPAGTDYWRTTHYGFIRDSGPFRYETRSAVVTRDFSDWSVLPRNDNPSSVWMRLQRFNDTVQISYSLDGNKWSMIRLAYFPAEVPVKIGMLTAAPGKQSFQVHFDDFSIQPLNALRKKTEINTF